MVRHFCTPDVESAFSRFRAAILSFSPDRYGRFLLFLGARAKGRAACMKCRHEDPYKGRP